MLIFHFRQMEQMRSWRDLFICCDGMRRLTLSNATWNHLESARKLPQGHHLWMSLDPLDAEVGMVLAAGLSNTALEEILIVDPNHSVIAHRINLLLDRRRDIKVTGMDCLTMEEEADYTIWRKR